MDSRYGRNEIAEPCWNQEKGDYGNSPVHTGGEMPHLQNYLSIVSAFWAYSVSQLPSRSIRLCSVSEMYLSL